MQLKWGDCITDDNIDGLIACVCWNDILDTERAHIFDMYTREYSINPAWKRDRPTTVFAFSRKSSIRTVIISQPKISRDFSRASGTAFYYRIHYRCEIVFSDFTAVSHLFDPYLIKNEKSKMRSTNSSELWYFSRCVKARFKFPNAFAAFFQINFCGWRRISNLYNKTVYWGKKISCTD